MSKCHFCDEGRPFMPGGKQHVPIDSDEHGSAMCYASSIYNPIPRCPTCDEEATYQTPDGTYWCASAHHWKVEIAHPAAPSSPTPTPAESDCAKCGGSGEIEIGCAMDHALTAPCVECHGKGTIVTAPAESTRVAGEGEIQYFDDGHVDLGEGMIEFDVLPAPAATSDSARRAAEELERENWLLSDVTPEERQKIIAIISKHFATTPTQPSPSLADAIAKVREMRRDWRQEEIQDEEGEPPWCYYVDAADYVIKALESLTPDDVVLVSREEAAKVCDGLVTFDPDHEKYTPEDESVPCGWCDGLERAAEKIRSLPAYGDRKDG